MRNGKYLWLAFTIWSLVILLDGYLSSCIPEQLNTITGVYSPVSQGRDKAVKLSTPEGNYFFTCGLGIQTGGGRCFSYKDSPAIKGELATIVWYRQSVIPTGRQNMVVEFRMGGETLISRAETERRLKKELDGLIFIYGVFGGVSAFIFIYRVVKERWGKTR